MEFRQLRYFVATAEAQHFRRAAASLRIAQPALSRQIKALEEEIGVSLFERSPQGVRLTEAGRSRLLDATRIMNDVGEAAERTRRTARGQRGRIRVAFSEVLSGHPVLTRSIRRFRAAAPDVEITLLPMVTSPQIEALRASQVDAGFLFHRHLDAREFAWREMSRETALVAVPRKHSLARRRTVRLQDLSDQPLLCVGEHINPGFYRSVVAAFTAASITPRIVQQANSLVVLSLVETGMGIGIVSSALRWRITSQLVMRPVEEFLPSTSINLVWRKTDHSAVLRSFVATVTASKDTKAD
jgi:LysR family transcriptional regulator, benzoate and cis,cis-muconate-responsive activator of ben and cat genes